MRFAIVLVSLAAITQYAYAGCGGNCGCGCGPIIPISCGCGLESSGEDMCRGTKDCVPMVVRPQEMQPSFLRGSAGGSGGSGGSGNGGAAGTAAAALAAVANALSFKPVPGPCAVKKAIVKPAVLPKPVCRPPMPTCVCDSHMSHNYQTSSCSSCSHQVNGCYGPTVDGIHRGGYGALYGGLGGNGRSGPFGSVGPYGPVGPDGRTCGQNEANCAPADAVSLSLAYKMAQQENYNHMANEDKLNFGFRKIPQEMPVQKVVQNNVPEEKIFSLNGQIVELKPVRVGSSKTLAEEAAEDLQALQDEEEENAQDGSGIDGGVSSAVRRVSLGELGYGPAKMSTPTFVNVPSTVIDAANEAASSLTGGILGGSGSGGSGSSGCCGSCGGCGGCGSCCECKVIPGNVDYKILPKAPQVCFQPPPPPDSCESAEACISEEKPGSQISCMPVCVRKHSCSCKKSGFSIHKLL